MKRMLCIMANPRSGTTALRHALSETGKFNSYGEIFHDELIDQPGNFFNYIRKKHFSFAEALDGIAAITDTYLSDLFGERKDLIPLIDVKTTSWNTIRPLWRHIVDEPYFLSKLKEIGCFFIFITRKNLTDQLLSMEIASHIQKWHNITDDDIPFTFSIDLKALHKRALLFVKSESLLYSYIKDYPKHISIAYEELFCENTVNRRLNETIQNNLAISLPDRIKTPIHKNKGCKKSIIENYDIAKRVVDEIIQDYRTPFVDDKKDSGILSFENIINKRPVRFFDIHCVVDELKRNKAEKVIVYGSAEMAEYFFSHAKNVGIHILAFFESEPKPEHRGPDGEPVLTPEDALKMHPETDILIASKSSINPMLHRLLKIGIGKRKVWII